MHFFLLNVSLITTLSALILLISISLIFISLNKNSKSNLKYLFFFRFIATLVILFFLFHPVLKFEKYENEKNKMNIYIDNSASMLNNISIDSLKEIVNRIIQKSSDNFIVETYLFGDSVRSVSNGVSLKDASSDFRDLNDFISSNNVVQNIIISDGLNFMKSSNYNSYKPINTIGIGLPDSTATLSVSKAKIKDGVLTYDIDWYNIGSKILDLYIFKGQDIISGKKINIEGVLSGSIIDTINIEREIVDNFQNLRVGVDYDFDHNNFDNYSNVFSDEYVGTDILLMTGVPSLNTRYIKNILNSLSGNTLHFFLENNFDVDYSNIRFVVFDNYPTDKSQLNNFNQTIVELKDKKIPFVMTFGPNQDFDIINEISSNFNFSISNNVDDNLVFQYNDIYNEFLSSYILPPTSFYRILTNNNNPNNIYYSNGSPVVLIEGISMLIFCPNLSYLSYKLSNNSSYFDNLFDVLIRDVYYQNNHMKIFVDRNKFYNNEQINVYLNNNSKKIYKNLVLQIKDSANNIYGQYMMSSDTFDEITIPGIHMPGKYNLELFDKNKKISNNLILEIYNYDKEKIAKGQDIYYLNKIANQTGGLYSNESNYFANLDKNSIIDETNRLNEIYDSKNYLFALLIAIFSICLDWFLRKKRGLL